MKTNPSTSRLPSPRHSTPSRDRATFSDHTGVAGPDIPLYRYAPGSVYLRLYLDVCGPATGRAFLVDGLLQPFQGEVCSAGSTRVEFHPCHICSLTGWIFSHRARQPGMPFIIQVLTCSGRLCSADVEWIRLWGVPHEALARRFALRGCFSYRARSDSSRSQLSPFEIRG